MDSRIGYWHEVHILSLGNEHQWIYKLTHAPDRPPAIPAYVSSPSPQFGEQAPEEVRMVRCDFSGTGFIPSWR